MSNTRTLRQLRMGCGERLGQAVRVAERGRPSAPAASGKAASGNPRRRSGR